MQARPAHPATLAGDALDGACRVIGEFADLKSVFTLGHSPAVAELAEAAAWRLGLAEAEVAVVRRAGLVHDLGRVAVSTGLWEKPAALTTGEWERVRLHTVLRRAGARPVRRARATWAPSQRATTSGWTARAITAARRRASSRSPPACSPPPTPTRR